MGEVSSASDVGLSIAYGLFVDRVYSLRDILRP
jgi:hypothetical protein